MDSNKDLRLFNQEKYLKNATLKETKFKERTTNDHKHCEFCWAKFAETTNDLHSGFATLDEKYWICPQCFNDFKAMFDWNLVR
ncbi:MAG: hypothetical protein LBL34_05450 [Clostridiales bacterium]|jgi:hypothetical protein|nr:hypothetical protein [Clostridiales bacterium]